MIIAVLGLGEAGSVFASAYADAGWNVVGYDPADVQVDERIQRAASIAEAVSGADVVLSLTTARHAVGAAREAAPVLKSTAVFVDLNVATPALKHQVREALGEGVLVADGAVLGSVQKHGAGVHLLLSGNAVEQAARALEVVGARVDPLDGDMGDASRRKLLRSVFVKGLAALISESMDGARAAGDEQWIKAQMAEWLQDGDATIERLQSTTRVHAVRRSHELSDSLQTLRELGVESSVAMGALQTHLRYAREGAAESAPGLAEKLAVVPTSAIGDMRQRRGMLDSAISRVWPSAPIAGRAFTVETRPGDNRAIHEALERVEPGDVLMVDGGGDTQRALMGELIGERARDLGVAGMVIDGAIRDVLDLQEIGFPVWARAVSPAGPYRDGPGRLGGPISLGGVVCSTGDMVVADADGVIVLPALEAESALQGGLEKLAREDEQRQAWRRQMASRMR
ncbi:DUF1932 domain-containing protein [Cellulosimicrobium funkei]|nr:DUF1932 domain-containing protein [Cellulosimicrobium funkei]